MKNSIVLGREQGRLCLKNRLSMASRFPNPGSHGSFLAARRYALPLLGVGLLFVGGCRASMWGLPIALTGSAVTQIDASNMQDRLIGKPLASADRLFGESREMLTDQLTGDRYARYPIRSLPRLRHCYVVRLTYGDQIADVQRWIQNHDGFEDSFKSRRIKRKITNRFIQDAEQHARLEEPVLVLSGERTSELLHVYNATNFTHLRPRILAIHVDSDGRCNDATYFGIAGSWKCKPNALVRTEVGQID
jgi:hypothetical protein